MRLKSQKAYFKKRHLPKTLTKCISITHIIYIIHKSNQHVMNYFSVKYLKNLP